jgi:hypothetical protein
MLVHSIKIHWPSHIGAATALPVSAQAPAGAWPRSLGSAPGLPVSAQAPAGDWPLAPPPWLRPRSLGAAPGLPVLDISTYDYMMYRLCFILIPMIT